MMTAPESRWFAVQTKPNQESTARRGMESLGLETLLPLVRRERCRSGRPLPRIRPLFPNYLFARFAPARFLHLIRYSRGVCRVVGTAETPAPVDESIIDDLRSRVGEDGLVPLESRGFHHGDPVRIEAGPLQGWSGIFERELDDQERVVILLNALLPARIVLGKHSLQPA